MLEETELPLVIFPAAYYLLKEFGGLRIILGDKNECLTYILSLDPRLATTGWFEHGWTIGLPVFPLGILHAIEDESNEHCVGIDTSGRIWVFAYEEFLAGHNIQEALEYLASPGVKQPVEDSDLPFLDKGDEADEIYKAIVQQL